MRRKILIALISLAIVAAGFWIYVALMDTAPIQIPQGRDSRDLDVARAVGNPQPTGDTTLETVERPQFFKYDPVTKEIAAEYGFELLLNPGQGSSRWQVEKPYLVFYQKGYQYRIDAERGLFQVETAGSQSIPKDAQLDENVVIHITPRSGSRIDETTIRMDDLTFSSERSEFVTDGPVTIESDQIQMKGYGLIVVFNAGIGKIEYLQIKDLDFLRLKGLASSLSRLTDKPSEKAIEDSEQLPAQPDKQTVARGMRSNHETAPQAAAPEPSTPLETNETADSSKLYQCAVRDNVIIQYGKELIVSGADQVHIRNILLANMNDTVSTYQTDEKDTVRKTKSDRLPSSSQRNKDDSISSSLTSSSSVVSEDESEDIVVRCDGGMIIQQV